jgi:hypothetical protein
MRSAILFLTLAAFVTPPAWAADLTKIERSLRKEPVYQTKMPKYCLLVFGPEAKTRVWLVLDGKTLYVDRNANGDLTDDGEKIAGKKGLDVFGEDGEYLFKVDEIHDGLRTHKNLSLTVRKLAYFAERSEAMKKWLANVSSKRGYSLKVEVELPGWKGEGAGGRIQQLVLLWDARGLLTFADKPREAPIISFGGPWQILFLPGNRLTVGGESNLILGVGTPGLGAGTTAFLGYPGVIPETLHPRVEITYPPKNPGDPPEKRLYELKERC